MKIHRRKRFDGSFITRRLFIVAAIACMAFAFGGCGGAGYTTGGDDAIDATGALSPSSGLGDISPVEKDVYTKSYAGRLIVHFDERLGIRMREDRTLYSTTGNEAAIHAISRILDAHPAIEIKRFVDLDERQVDVRRMQLEDSSGREHVDWNSVYQLKIADPDEAVRALRAFDELGAVNTVYPDLVIQDMSLGSTPDLIMHQGYLYGSAEGGLNAVYAWSRGVYGAGVTVVDGESGWNVNHADLPLSEPGSVFTQWDACFVGDPDPNCYPHIAHGTAIVGLLGALDNGHGVTGFAPSSLIKVVGAEGVGPANIIKALTDGVQSNGEVMRGSIILFPVAFKGKLTPGEECGEDIASQYGCMPIDIQKATFDAVNDATDMGITIIEGAANGSMNLDDPTVYRSTDVYLSDIENDSGAIIVGASLGANHVPYDPSNCGMRVNSYAWGRDVVTTGYPHGLYDWNGIVPPVPPNTDPDAFFVDMFGGTSAATAMVAGAAALVQSYAKQTMGNTRYLMPRKLREILVNSGLTQSGGGCNIGKQPRVDVALGLIDAAWNAWKAAYPQLITNQMMMQEDIGDLRNAGLGIICVDGDPDASDPVCADDSLYPSGTGIAATLDFDADGRADLVSWKRGWFQMDFSSYGPSGDGFGGWDVIVAHPQIAADHIVWPYVEDMNSDGRTDFVLYDKTSGTWYIKYMTSAILSGSAFSAWDDVITTNVHDQMEMDAWESQYCRPHPADYDGDGWVDLAVACSDGIWYIAYNANIDPSEPTFEWVPWPSSIVYGQEVNYLTPGQLLDAPGWAYLTGAKDISSVGKADLLIKVPDGLPDEGKMIALLSPDFTDDYFEAMPHIFGGNSSVFFLGKFSSTYTGSLKSVGVKNVTGDWLMADPTGYAPLYDSVPNVDFGDVACHPITADFDGDGKDDRTVMCPDGWMIAYSGDIFASLKTNGVRVVPNGYNTSEFTLPGRSYSGGISYTLAQDLMEILHDYNPSLPPPIMVDMVSISMCQLVSGGCQ